LREKTLNAENAENAERRPRRTRKNGGGQRKRQEFEETRFSIV
jgi:hypothetical protein